jgi:hypothetical protein
VSGFCSASEAAAHYSNPRAQFEVWILVQCQKWHPLHVSLKNGEIERRGSAKDPAYIVNSAISHFRNRVDRTFDCVRSCNESPIA